MGSLSNLYISQSYQSLIHLGTNNTASATLIDLQDGLGNSIGVSVNTGGDLSLSGSLTASLQQGYVWVGNASGKTSLVATSSFIDTFISGNLVTTASFNAYTQSNDQRVNALEVNSASVNISITNINSTTQSLQSQLTTIGGQSGSWITESETGSFVTTSSFNSYTSSTNVRLNNIETTTASLLIETSNLETFSASALISINNLNGATGSYATTGSNTFTGDQTLVDEAGNSITISDVSGSLYLVAKGFTSASAHLSASAAGIGNIIFKTNNNTADTIISGSANIFTNQGAPTAGFKRYIGGNNNYFNGTLGPQISGSMAFSPAMNRNIGNSQFIMRGPVSSSTWTINDNIVLSAVQIGTSAANNAEKLVSGLTIQTSLVLGTLAVVANRTFISGTMPAATIASSQIANATVNMASSSVQVANLFQQGPNTNIINDYYNASATGTGNGFQVTVANAVIGQGHTIYASGSNTTNGTNRQFYNNGIIGSYISASVNQNGDETQMNSTIILGHGLNVTGSSPISTTSLQSQLGSVFVGRFNALDTNRNKTAQTIFAVGTGTIGTRKTGFLIDSGSNTFVEGTLNVSGSTTMTGSLFIQSGSALPSQTGSSVLTWNSTNGQVGQSSFLTLFSASLSVGAFNSTISQSGSANVSQSMTFNNTDVINGITLNGGGTQLTVSNSGTYNIQFSAQLLADTGADTVYIWLKKNGTNVSNTATKLALRNNEEVVAAWNFVVTAVANDYFELVWQNTNGDAILLKENASGNVPAIPSVIVTVTQVK